MVILNSPLESVVIVLVYVYESLKVKVILPSLSTPVPNSPCNVPLIVTVLLYSVLGVALISKTVLRIRAFISSKVAVLVLYLVLF